MRTLLVALLVVATGGAAAASPFALRIDMLPASAHVGDGFDVRVRITNTDHVAHRVNIGCGSEAQFASSDPAFSLSRLDAAKCASASTVLAPGHSMTRVLQFESSRSATLGRHDVALTFTPFGSNDPATSPPRPIQLVARSHP